MSVLFAGKSDCGLIRKNNEDSFVIIPDLAGGSGVVLADGMGGHNKGELASSVAATYAAGSLRKEINSHLSPREMGEILAEIAERANVKVYLESLLSPQNTGMGTTLTIGLVMDDLLIISHVGDCRVYRKHKSKLQVLTTDHTLTNALLRRGEITPEQALHHSGRHIITRALGVAEYISVDVYVYKLSLGDRLMFCTDGLYGYATDQEIYEILSNSTDPTSCAQNLIDQANQNGGGDNVTVVVGFI